MTERSVRRDIDALRELGYPVHATSGVGGGYALGAGRDLPPLPLEDDEALAVAFGLRAVASGWVTGLEDAAVSALSKLEAVLPRRLRGRMGDLSAVSLHAPPPGPRADGAVLASLASACRAERVVAFDYTDATGARRPRVVEPARLVHHGGRWYLVAWDRDREGWRTFRVDRVGPEVEPRHAFRPRPPPAEDLRAYVARGAQDRWRHRARITVHAPVEQVARRVPAAYGELRALDEGRCELLTGGDDLAWLGAYLGLIGAEFEVHEPPELGAALRELAGRLERAAQPREASN